MNILGRVVGGILILISLAWFARIAQVFPFSRSANQLTGGQSPTTKTTTAVSANGQRVGTAPLNAPRATANTAIAQTTTPSGTSTAGAATTAQVPPAQPVTAAW